MTEEQKGKKGHLPGLYFGSSRTVKFFLLYHLYLEVGESPNYAVTTR
jgi:hypothetical protein